MSLTLLVDAALKGTVLLVSVFLIAQALRRTSAAARHLLWSLALLGVLALPVLSTVLPWRVDILPGRSITSLTGTTPPSTLDLHGGAPSGEENTFDEAAVPRSTTETTAPSSTAEATAASSPSEPAAARIRLPTWESVIPLVGLVWLAGTTLVLFRLAVGIVRVWRVARHGTPLPEGAWRDTLERAALRLGIDQPIRAVTNPSAPMPFTTGFFRPLIVLPAGATGWNGERPFAVLLHELAHLRRADFLTHLMAEVACALYWFHPLVWVAARKMRAESERACDDLVLRAGTRPSEYAGHLLDIVRGAGRSRAPAIAVPMAQRSEFEGRLLAILEPDVKRHGLTPLTRLGIVVAITLTAIPLAAMGPARETPAAQETDRVDPEPIAGEGESDRVGVDDAPTLTVPARGTERESERRVSDPSPPAAEAPRRQSTDGLHTTALTEALADADTGVRRAAAQALGELQDTTALAALMRALTTDSDAEVRRAAAWALGEMENPRAVPALAEALQRDPDIQVRRTAVWALGELEDARAIDALGAAVGDQDVEIKRAAIRALEEIDDARAIPMVIPALRDSDPETRSLAVWALGEIESPRAINALGSVLQNDDHAEVRRRAAWALGEIEDARAAQALGAGISDSDLEVRRTVIRALGELEDASALDALAVAAQDADMEIRLAAVHAMGEIEDPAAVDALAAALRDADVDVRRRAAWALGEIEDRRAVAPLSAALGDEDTEVRRTSAWALGEIEDPTAADALGRALSDANLEVRLRAVWALGEIELRQAPPALLAALGDEDAGVRRAAVRAVGEIEDPAAVPGLANLINDADPETRRPAVRALSEIRSPAAYEALVQALQSEDSEIRRWAARALGRNRE